MGHLLSIAMAMCLSLAALGGCHVSSIGGMKPSEHRISRAYNNVKGFSMIEVDAMATIEYRQSDKASVTVEGPDNYVPLIFVKEENGMLKITTKKGTKFAKGDLVKIKLSSPDLKKMENKGTSNIKLVDTIRVANLDIESDAVGNIKVEHLICDTLTVDIEGVGNLTMAGRCKSAVYEINGVGNLKAQDMKAEVLKVEQDGVGNVSCYASRRLDVKSDGVGNVKYAGNPEVKNLHSDGVGSIKAIK